MRHIAVTGSAQVAGVRTTAELIASGAGTDTVLDQVRAQLTELLALRGCRFVREEPTGRPPVLQPDGRLLWGRSVWDVESLGLPGDEIELPARFQGQPQGRFMLLPTAAAAPPVAARQVAVILADLVGAELAARSAEPMRPR